VLPQPMHTCHCAQHSLRTEEVLRDEYDVDPPNYEEWQVADEVLVDDVSVNTGWTQVHYSV